MNKLIIKFGVLALLAFSSCQQEELSSPNDLREPNQTDATTFGEESSKATNNYVPNEVLVRFKMIYQKQVSATESGRRATTKVSFAPVVNLGRRGISRRR